MRRAAGPLWKDFFASKKPFTESRRTTLQAFERFVFCFAFNFYCCVNTDQKEVWGKRSEMRKRQREESNEGGRRNKKQKIQPKIFVNKEFMLNEADPELTDLLEKNGAQVYLFSYYGGGFYVRTTKYTRFNYSYSGPNFAASHSKSELATKMLC